MLDADGYPKAYLKIDNIKIELSEKQLEDLKILIIAAHPDDEVLEQY